jgi:hypothetical protein
MYVIKKKDTLMEEAMQDDGWLRLMDDRKLRKGGREGGCVWFGARPHMEAGRWCLRHKDLTVRTETFIIIIIIIGNH